MTHRFLALASLIALAAAGCSNGTTNSTTTTPTTTTSPTTNSFSSRLPPRGSASRTFPASQAGTVTVTLVSTSPSTIVGLGIGVPLGGISGCTLSTSVNAAAGATPQIAAAVDAGSYCVAIYDPGTLTSAVDFEITIVYP